MTIDNQDDEQNKALADTALAEEFHDGGPAYPHLHSACQRMNQSEMFPGMSLRDDRTKSNDDLECALRHLLEGDYRGAHWRVARLHQKQLEAEGAPVAPLAYFGEDK